MLVAAPYLRKSRIGMQAQSAGTLPRYSIGELRTTQTETSPESISRYLEIQWKKSLRIISRSSGEHPARSEVKRIFSLLLAISPDRFPEKASLTAIIESPLTPALTGR